MQHKLFHPDIFSKNIPLFQDSNESVKQLIQSILKKHYSQIYNEITYVGQFQGNEINSNNYKVVTPSGVYLVKMFIDINEYNKLQKILLLNNWLNTYDIQVAKIYPSNKGEFIIQEANSFWGIFDFIDGDFFTGINNIELLSVAQHLSSFFTKMKELPSDIYPIDTINYIYDDSILMSLMQKNQKNWHSYFGQELASILNENWLFLNNTYKKTSEKRKKISNEQLIPSHVDLHPHNILVYDNQLTSILDIDSIKLDFPLVSISFSMYKLLKQSIISRGIKDNSLEISKISKLYLNTFRQGFPILESEIGNLYLYAVTEIFRRILIIFSLNLNDNDKRWNHVLPIHINGLKEAQIIFKSLNEK